MKRLVLSLCLVLLSASVAKAAPITVMRFSGAINYVAPNLSEFLPVVDITVGTWFVGSLWIDDEFAYRPVNFDITIGNHHITAGSAHHWMGETERYESLYGNWSALRGGYIDPITLFGTAYPQPTLLVHVVGPGMNQSTNWLGSGVIGTIYNVPEPSTMILLALGVMFVRKTRA